MYTVPGSVELARFNYRENRFIAYVNHNGDSIRCHLPNPGRMTELLSEGAIVYIRFHDNPTRKTAATLVAVEKEDELIQLDSNLVSKLIPIAVENKLVGFEDLEIIKQEYTVGKHRFDFLFQRGSEEIITEVKSTTRVVNDVACFPDAVSARASSHLSSLIRLSDENHTMIIFMIYRKAKSFSPCYDIDEKFAKIFYKAVKSGVEVRIIQCKAEIIEKHDEKFIGVSILNQLDLLKII